jgi:phenylpropionate dioxygenase-like ring-hydroxylating dioxygenase large terminal subunit
MTEPDQATQAMASQRSGDRRESGRLDWSTWPQYEASVHGLPGRYWYPVMWSVELRDKPVAVQIVNRRVMLVRDRGTAYALHDRCPHRGVPLSLGDKQFPATLSCPYHGWTFDLASGGLCAVITDGPDSPLVGKVNVKTFPVAERLGLVWLFIGPDEDCDGLGEVPPVDEAIPVELRNADFALGGNIEVRSGGWRFGAENGFDEGHAKYLHRDSLWRILKLMPTWTKTVVVDDADGWITRVQKEVHWSADFPGLGRWSGERWWKVGSGSKMLEGPKASGRVDRHIAALKLAGQQSIRLPGLLRIVHRNFIHYEWYVPIDTQRYRYVQVLVEFKRGLLAFLFKLRYLTLIRWLFHGQFSAQDKWMVDVMDAPPERLYRPDVSITAWRRLCEHAPAAGQARMPDRVNEATTSEEDLVP